VGNSNLHSREDTVKEVCDHRDKKGRGKKGETLPRNLTVGGEPCEGSGDKGSAEEEGYERKRSVGE